MRKLIEALEFCVFDLETTGLDPEAGAEPIEAGAVRIDQGEITEIFESFASPRREIPGEVQGLTGIFPSDVRDAPAPAAVLGELMDFAGETILVAHNIDFDRSFLDVYAPGPVPNDEIDTLRMARTLIAGTDHSLDHLVNRLNLTRDNAHRALDDARATAELFLKLADRVDTYDDYAQCGIPRRVLREDLDRVLSRMDRPTSERLSLTESFGTTRELLEASPRDVAARTGLENSVVRDLRDEVEEFYEDQDRTLRPSVRFTNCYQLRFWEFSNYVLNGLGLLMLLSGLVATSPQAFYAGVLTSVPFFVLSPIMTYLRERFPGVMLRLTVTLVVFALWGTVLTFFGQLGPIRRQLVSLLESGGLY